MLVTIGDLVDDVVVRPGGPIRSATDTTSIISRRQGGSAANVAVAAAGITGRARFVGCVGDDAMGSLLVGELAGAGVDTAFVQRRGTTGTIVVLLDADGERTMLTDRRSCVDLSDPDPSWLDGASSLHLPLYSLVGGRLADTAMAVATWAVDRGVPVAVDLSSVALLDDLGPAALTALLRRVRPAVVLANEDEAPHLAVVTATDPTALADVVTIEKRGARPAIATMVGSGPIEVDAEVVDGLADTTGAGDAFAAGLLAAGPSVPFDAAQLVDAVRAGHAAAAQRLRRQG